VAGDERREEAISRVLRPALEHMGYRLLDARLDGTNLSLFIDREGGVGVDDCRKASEKAGFILEMDDEFTADYRLEVSSPGADRPLRFPADIQEHLGDELKLKLWEPAGKKCRGRLVSCDEQSLVLAIGGEDLAFELANIRRANLVPKAGKWAGKQEDHGKK
jgi:ribosome maturation factor RimP